MQPPTHEPPPATDLFVGLHGANLVVRNPQGKILIEHSKRKKGYWELPGGGIDRGESQAHAAMQETLEETGVVVDEENLRLIAILDQRVPKYNSHGYVFLFFTDTCNEEGLKRETEECDDVVFARPEDIMRNYWRDMALAHKRMLLYYARWASGYYKPEQLPIMAKLSTEVDYFWKGHRVVA